MLARSEPGGDVGSRSELRAKPLVVKRAGDECSEDHGLGLVGRTANTAEAELRAEVLGRYHRSHPAVEGGRGRVRAPTGHVTREMQDHQLTSGTEEKRAALAGALSFVKITKGSKNGERPAEV